MISDQINRFLKNLFGRFVSIAAIRSAKTDISIVQYNRESQLPDKRMYGNQLQDVIFHKHVLETFISLIFMVCLTRLHVMSLAALEPGGNLPGWNAVVVRSGPGDVETEAGGSVSGGQWYVWLGVQPRSSQSTLAAPG